MVFSLLIIIHNHDRMSSITRVLHISTWKYFTLYLPSRFTGSPKAVKEAIMAVINALMQDFWRTSCDSRADGASILASHDLVGILEHILMVCYVIIATAADLDDKDLQMQKDSAQTDFTEFKILFDGYRKMFDQSLSESKDLGDMVRFLPGFVVQKDMSMRGMANLYRIKPDLLEHLNSTIDLLKPSYSGFILNDYLSNFLQDRDRSQLCYCDPMLQHISICRQFLSLLDGSNAFDLPSPR